MVCNLLFGERQLKTAERRKYSEKDTSPESYLRSSAFLSMQCFFWSEYSAVLSRTVPCEKTANSWVDSRKTAESGVTERALDFLKLRCHFTPNH